MKFDLEKFFWLIMNIFFSMLIVAAICGMACILIIKTMPILAFVLVLIMAILASVVLCCLAYMSWDLWRKWK